ncbi:MAG: LysM peptidoglycan-binding domain-containing protein [Bacteroidetes bacterium]|nr:MAG: LysM peptidoglycan-binding domain-containing protein [Bacteroidota bacterium]
MIHTFRFYSQTVIFFLVFLVVTFYPGKTLSQGGLSLSEYIENYQGIAMDEMRMHGIPASIKLAQGILESGFGNSDLAVVANNHFGIKCHGWQGRTFYKDDDKPDECFRAYDDPLQSFRDHSEFLTGRPRYASLFELDVTDYKGWARGLRQAGYATNPRYPELLIGVIERNSLYEFDRMVIAGGDYKPAATQRPAQRPVASGRTRQSGSEDFPSVGIGREVLENNRIRYVYARRGDTPESLADELGVWAWEIYRYNDLERSDRLTEGQIVYLQPKRRNASQNWHVVQQGETMLDISQKHGIRLRMLYRRNSMEPGSEPQPGQRLQLRARIRR